ncbi:amidase protein [Rutstroemia sp. NJR-2017a BVV2]|nr:amidase protein [Rutstroemia sp. NJR-2017a BVV2]
MKLVRPRVMYDFESILGLLYSFIQQPSVAPSKLELDIVSISELLRGLQDGQFSSEDLVRVRYKKTYIERIAQVNSTIRAVAEINRASIAIAKQKDHERSRGSCRGILHGIPILVKNLFLTTDGLKCTYGCTGLLDAVPSIEATTVRKLREQGAVILGVANGSQFANFRNTSGWSAVGGQCLGIYHTDQSPSGSSSGSAVAVALGLCAAALGTETSGSIIMPLSKSAVVGIKPTVGLTSRYGVYSASEWQDTVGVLAKNVQDAVILLTAITGPDDKDPFTISDPRDGIGAQKVRTGTDFTKACTNLGLDGLRIASSTDLCKIPRHLLKKVDKTTTQLFNRAIDEMRSIGATIIDPANYSKFGVDRSSPISGGDHDIALTVDVYNNMKRSLSNFATNPHNLYTFEDVIEYLKTTPAEEASIRTLEYFENYVTIDMGKQIPKLLERYSCDVIMLPTKVACEPADVGGNPVVGVPMGYYPEDTEVTRKQSNGLVDIGPGVPIGVSFIGKRWDDYKLISVAYAFEQATLARSNGKPVVRCTRG